LEIDLENQETVLIQRERSAELKEKEAEIMFLKAKNALLRSEGDVEMNLSFHTS